MKDFKITYYLGGDKRYILIKAEDKKTALIGFYQNVNYDDVVRVEELNV